jgi:hypothetical protein
MGGERSLFFEGEKKEWREKEERERDFLSSFLCFCLSSSLFKKKHKKQ